MTRALIRAARPLQLAAALALLFTLPGCGMLGRKVQVKPEAPTAVETKTSSHEELKSLPPAARKLVVAVYAHPDETGQFKPSESVTTYSKAVTQGGSSILIKALKDAGQGQWFTVIERHRLDHLLKERQIIREMRARHGEKDNELPPLLFAGVILEGGIVGFDSNTLTGGLGARYLGIGASTEYRQDTVTVYLRAVSTQSGEILKSVTARKTLVSYGASASAFRFVSFKKLLEFETGYTSNEPAQLAIKQAIEKAVHALVIEGAAAELWSFADPALGAEQTMRYRAEQGADEVIAACLGDKKSRPNERCAMAQTP